jgi:type I restriction enzyme S subunit
MSKVKIGNITDSCLGKMLDAEKNKGDYEPYLANINVRWGSFDLDNLSQMKFEPDEQVRYELNDGDLIMCEGGEPGRCAIWHNEVPNMKIQKALHRIRPHDCLDIRFLYYWFLLAGRMGWLTRYFTETTIKHLPGESLKDVELDLPKLSIQQGIADVLSAIDDKIALNKRINAELEAMAKTLYDYWFVQFDFPDENGKPYHTSGGAMVWNEQLKRKIPKGWSVSTLSDVANITMGQSPSGDSYNEDGDGMPFFQGSTDFGIDFPMTRVYTTQPSRIAAQSDILLSVRAPVGTMNTAYEKCCIGRGLAALNSKLGASMYLHCLLKGMKPFFDVINGNGTTFGALTKDTLFNAFVVVPDDHIVNAFESSVTNFTYERLNNEKQTRELTRLRDWLLPMLMNGQATVADKQPTEAPQNVVEMPGNNKRFDLWLQNQGIAARGNLDKKTLKEIFDAMDDDDK